ncbi:MAG: tetratricopeptide repeat protein [Ktedonobacteraceae bacterium]|nr:tetratricopeptide repeat protein [Ktedonobacteraceae bacterium]
MHEYPHQEISVPKNDEDFSILQEITPTLASNTDIHCAHQLRVWLDLPTAREQRRYLEVHCDLLSEHSEIILHSLFPQELEGPTQVQQRCEARLLLQDARRRGGTTEAVREAYVNLHGGFVLDSPPWLEAVELRLTELLNQNRLEETAETRVTLLQEALARIQEDSPNALEFLATLHRELADAWLRHPLTNHAQALEVAIHFYEGVLQIFTVARYPHQYAKAQKGLGVAYWSRIVGQRDENLERAIACYHEVLRIHTSDDFPFDYARVQTNLGITYWSRSAGERRENLEHAIAW